MARAVSAAIKRTLVLDAMAYHANATMRTTGSERVYGAFEAVEHMQVFADFNFKRRVIIIAANFADWHSARLRFCSNPERERRLSGSAGLPHFHFARSDSGKVRNSDEHSAY
jgi:hypothetical protein